MGPPKVQPPPPPPPAANPPTYASALSSGPQGGPSLGRFGGMASSILTGPLGAERNSGQRKSLLGA